MTSSGSAALPSKVGVWLCFGVGCLVTMAASSLATFNAYAKDIKDIFSYSQIEVEVLVFLGNLGQCAALPTGFLLEKFGPRLALFTAMLFVTPFYLLLWSAGDHKAYYHTHVALTGIYFFCIGVGSTIMYLTSLTMNLNNFPRRHRGKVVGFLGVLFWVGPLVFAILYGTLYPKKHSTDYFLVLGIITFVVNFMGLFFLKRVREPPGDPVNAPEANAKEPPVQQSSEHIWPEAVTLMEIDNNVDCREVVLSPTYHLLAWTFILSSSVDLAYLSNQGIILDSCGTSQYSFTSNMVGPVVAACANVVSGILSDRFAKVIPRETYIVVCCLLQSAVMLYAVFDPCSSIGFFACLVIGYLSYGVNFTIIPTLVCLYFGMRHFSRYWGAVTLAYGLVAGLLLLGFGVSYQHLVEKGIAYYCYGPQCFLWSFATGTLLAVLAMCLSLLLLILSILSRRAVRLAEREAQPTIKPTKFSPHKSHDALSETSRLAPSARRCVSMSYLNTGSELIQRSYTVEQAMSTDSTGLRDWLRTS